MLEWAAREKIAITEGPVDLGRRLTCFLRNPDSTLLECNEVKAEDCKSTKYTLVLGQNNYSSWSMRAWLLLKLLEVPFKEVTALLYRSESRQAVRAGRADRARASACRWQHGHLGHRSNLRTPIRAVSRRVAKRSLGTSTRAQHQRRDSLSVQRPALCYAGQYASAGAQRESNARSDRGHRPGRRDLQRAWGRLAVAIRRLRRGGYYVCANRNALSDLWRPAPGSC